MMRMVCLVVGFALCASAQQADRDAELIEPPTVNYPRMAAWLNIEGACEVSFTVDPEGYAVDPKPSCTRPVFCWTAKQAIASLRMQPAIKNGYPNYRTNVLYPIEYRFDGTIPDEKFGPLIPCSKYEIF